eukprot:358554-Chlamydomonas_euryale.AAC.8
MTEVALGECSCHCAAKETQVNRGDRGWTQAVEQRNTGQSSCCVHASMPVLPSFCEACPASTQPVPYREGSKASLQVGQAGPLRGVVPPLG